MRAVFPHAVLATVRDRKSGRRDIVPQYLAL
jgi:hypothetical protein